MNQNHNWHSLSVKQASQALETDLEVGLNQKEVRQRQKRFGINDIEDKNVFSNLKLILRQFSSPLVIILFVAGLITYLLGKEIDSLVIYLSILINAVFGFWEEHKVQKILKKLKKSLQTKTIVKRDGKKISIVQKQLIPGDIIILEPGNKVPADARLIETRRLKISQANLTGEWIPVLKKTKEIGEQTPLFERSNMVYMGCLVEAGEGQAIITNIGSRTETGKIADIVNQTKETKTPLQKKN